MSELIHTIILTLHILGSGIIIGGVFASLLILINERISKDNFEHLKFLWKFLTPTIGIQIISGIYLAASEWDKFGKNPLFWLKMGIFVIDGFFGGKILGDRIKGTTVSNSKEIEIPGSHRLVWISFLIFLTVITLGVFLAESGQ